MVKSTIVHLIISLALGRDWYLCQLDVNNTFLQVTLFQNVFMVQHPSFVDTQFSSYFFRIKKALYNLKQAP